MTATIHHGDALAILPSLASDSIDAIVTDPPAGIAFMGKEWDRDHGGREGWVKAFAAIFAECYRVAKPGARMLCWAIPRTSHWTACAIEDAGWIVENRLAHFFGSGFPKGKSQLKPAVEDWWLARKPGGKVPPLNVDECRIAHRTINGGNLADNPHLRETKLRAAPVSTPFGREGDESALTSPAGRWPPNLLLSHADACNHGACVEGCPVKMLDEQSGERPTSKPGTTANVPKFSGKVLNPSSTPQIEWGYGDTGTASRFFPQFQPDPFLYAPKASRRERNVGCEELPEVRCGTMEDDGYAWDGEIARGRQPRNATARNHHPTVKPQALMRWLCRLIAKPGQLVLDPFAGSGSTGVAALAESMNFVGIEREAEYVEIARARLAAAVPPRERAFHAIADAYGPRAAIRTVTALDEATPRREQLALALG